MAAMPLGVCLTLASALHAVPVFVPVQRFTLAWMHSIEKVRWEEDYAVAARPAGQPPVLLALKARVKGSAAGMEPPDDAVLSHGWYEYTPRQTILPELLLTRSEFTADYDWCMEGHCQTMSNLIASDKDITRVTPCFYSE
ncbi:MAG TPA: DUF1850 domain-containing protein, partial [Rhodoferax sp.]